MSLTLQQLDALGDWGADVLSTEPGVFGPHDAADAFSAVLSALSAPRARYVGAAAQALMGLARARVAWPSLLNLTPADPLTLRRLGYLAERLSGYDEDGSASLRELAQRLSESLTLDAAAPEAPLASETPRARELRLTRDEVHTRWKILSEPDVWAAYCT